MGRESSQRRSTSGKENSQLSLSLKQILADSCSNERHGDVVAEQDVGDGQEVHVAPVVGHQYDRILLDGLLELEEVTHLLFDFYLLLRVKVEAK